MNKVIFGGMVGRNGGRVSPPWRRIVVLGCIAGSMFVVSTVAAERGRGTLDECTQIYGKDPRVRQYGGYIRGGPKTAQGMKEWCRDYPKWGWITLGLGRTQCCYLVPKKKPQQKTTPPVPKDWRDQVRPGEPILKSSCVKNPLSYHCLLERQRL